MPAVEGYWLAWRDYLASWSSIHCLSSWWEEDRSRGSVWKRETEGVSHKTQPVMLLATQWVTVHVEGWLKENVEREQEEFGREEGDWWRTWHQKWVSQYCSNMGWIWGREERGMALPGDKNWGIRFMIWWYRLRYNGSENLLQKWCHFSRPSDGQWQRKWWGKGSSVLAAKWVDKKPLRHSSMIPPYCWRWYLGYIFIIISSYNLRMFN